MANIQQLKKSIEGSQLTLTCIADKLNLSRYGFYKKLNGKCEFKASEIAILKELLRLSDEKTNAIFFGDNSGK